MPVINALSSLWHPTQVLADLLTLHEHAHLFDQPPSASSNDLSNLPPLTIAYVGDSANVLHDMLVTYPRLGHILRVATPPQQQYQAPKEVWNTIEKLEGCKDGIFWTEDPRQAVSGADIVVTDTWFVVWFHNTVFYYSLFYS